ncbi:unnamed protein product [Miscanthus lutarioriparius]|uniref:DUF295 domain-containing protein n=1 Tax=Miscanthus lutarioriparius TaxID=422564 RepID=A0A811RQ06_9POAL|nr:unnamed protein product [Miscanthus lutarioriparius]
MAVPRQWANLHIDMVTQIVNRLPPRFRRLGSRLLLAPADATGVYCYLSGYRNHRMFPRPRHFGSYDDAWLFLAYGQTSGHRLINIRTGESRELPDVLVDDAGGEIHSIVVLIATLSFCLITRNASPRASSPTSRTSTRRSGATSRSGAQGMRFAPHHTSSFKVFRMTPNEEEADVYPWTWSELPTLDGRMLFVGRDAPDPTRWVKDGFKDGIFFLDDRSFYDDEMMFGGVNEIQCPCSDISRWSSEGPPPHVDLYFPERVPSYNSPLAWLLP